MEHDFSNPIHTHECDLDWPVACGVEETIAKDVAKYGYVHISSNEYATLRRIQSSDWIEGFTVYEFAACNGHRCVIAASSPSYIEVARLAVDADIAYEELCDIPMEEYFASI